MKLYYQEESRLFHKINQGKKEQVSPINIQIKTPKIDNKKIPTL